jgi:sulfatase maturation enzyme AslB (radical SAM superfamily)
MPAGFGSGKPTVIQLSDKKYYPAEQIEASLNAVEEIYFAGGEPLILDEHYQILSKIVAQGRARKVALSYSTNLSVINYKTYDIAELWKHFGYVVLVVSIDAVGELGEFVRHGLDWERLKTNFFKLKQANPHVSFNIAITVSALNVFNLHEIVMFFIDENWVKGHSFFINILHGPEYYNIQILPAAVKAEVETKLNSLFETRKEFFEKHGHLRKQLHDVILFMNAEDKSHLIPAFREKNSELDAKRNENSLERIGWMKA